MRDATYRAILPEGAVYASRYLRRFAFEASTRRARAEEVLLREQGRVVQAREWHNAIAEATAEYDANVRARRDVYFRSQEQKCGTASEASSSSVGSASSGRSGQWMHLQGAPGPRPEPELATAHMRPAGKAGVSMKEAVAISISLEGTLKRQRRADQTAPVVARSTNSIAYEAGGPGEHTRLASMAPTPARPTARPAQEDGSNAESYELALAYAASHEETRGESARSNAESYELAWAIAASLEEARGESAPTIDLTSD